VQSAARQAAADIVKALREAGFVAYFAGGCVRDELLGTEPEDYDVATNATPEQVKRLFPGAGEVGASFGVMLVHAGPKGGKGVAGGKWRRPVEVATFRSDGEYTDQRRPSSVSFTDAKNDAQRRDFTINAVFLDPLAAPTADSPVRGKVIDYVGGLEDLKAKVIRAVGDADARLSEDHLRALRAARFAARLGFAIEPGTADAVRRHARDLRGVSHERIGGEVRKMLVHPARLAAMRILEELDVADVILGDAGAGPVARRVPATLEIPGGTADLTLAVGLGAWMVHRQADGAWLELRFVDEAVERVRKSLLLSNDEEGSLRGVLLNRAAIFSEWSAARVARRKRLAMTPTFAGALAVVAAERPERSEVVLSDLLTMGVGASEPGPTPIVTGDMLIGLGLKPGPSFKRILDGVYDAQLEGRVSSPEEGMELVRTLGV